MKKKDDLSKISVNTWMGVVVIWFLGLIFCCWWAHALSSPTTILFAHIRAIVLSCSLLFCLSTCVVRLSFFSFFFLKGCIYLLLGKGREGEREGEKHQCVVAFHAPPTWDLACNPGTCPDWELNLDPLVHRLALNPLSHTSQGNCCQALLKNEDVEDVYRS